MEITLWAWTDKLRAIWRFTTSRSDSGQQGWPASCSWPRVRPWLTPWRYCSRVGGSGSSWWLVTMKRSLLSVRIYRRNFFQSNFFYTGQSLNDDIWHTVTLRRRGNIIEASVDEEDSKKGILMKLCTSEELWEILLDAATSCEIKCVWPSKNCWN